MSCDMWLDVHEDTYYVMYDVCHGVKGPRQETVLTDTPVAVLYCLLQSSYMWTSSIRAKFLDAVYAELARRA